MAGNKLKLEAKVKASTILEVVVAMVMIILVFGIAMMIYSNVIRGSLSVKKIRAQAVLQEAMLNAERSNDDTINQSFNVDDFRLELEIKPYNGDSRLADIHLTAYDLNQQKIAELQKVILNKNE